MITEAFNITMIKSPEGAIEDRKEGFLGSQFQRVLVHHSREGPPEKNSSRAADMCGSRPSHGNMPKTRKLWTGTRAGTAFIEARTWSRASTSFRGTALVTDFCQPGSICWRLHSPLKYLLSRAEELRTPVCGEGHISDTTHLFSAYQQHRCFSGER